MSTLDHIEASIRELETEHDALTRESHEFFSGMMKAKYSTLERRKFEIAYDANRKRIAEIDEELETLKAVRDYEREFALNRFRRPTGWMGSLVSRWLGPLPKDSRLIHPDAEQLAKVGSYRLFAGVLVVLAIGSLLLIAHFIPWMLVSPATLIMMGTEHLFGEAWGNVPGVIVIVVLLFFAGGIKHQNRYKAKFWDGAAMLEEQWFRMGAESWTAKQRFISTFWFGMVHVVNIIYPISSLLVVGVVGGVFMAAYLRAYKKTGSTQLATLASAKLHATYNRYAIVYMIFAVGLSMAYSTFKIFT